jgi:hypothetical protein
MILFTNSFNYIKINKKVNNIIDDDNKSLNILYSLPNSKKLYKLIKLIIKFFPEYNPEYIIDHIINSDLYSNSKIKKNEVLKYFSLLKQSVPNKLLLNKVLRETIKGIQTNSSHSISSNPFDSVNQNKKSEIINNNINNSKQLLKSKMSSNKTKVISIKCKNSNNSNCFLIGQYGSNFISTNYSLVVNNSSKKYNIKNYSFKKSIKNNASIINCPYDDHSMKNNTKEKVQNNKNIKNIKHISNKIIDIKKKSSNNVTINNNIDENKENIDINFLLIRNNEKNFINSLDLNKNIDNDNDNEGLNKIKKNDKKKKKRQDSKNKYHTPKKKKKIIYYK